MAKKLFFGLLILIALFIPLFIKTPYYIKLLILTLYYGYLGLSWNVLGGFAGQFSFGHAAFFGIGAYTSTLLFLHAGISPWIGMLIGGIISAVFGLGIGYLCFRYKLRGAYFALAVFAFASALKVIATNVEFVGGANGLLIPLKGNSLLLFQFKNPEPYYYIILLMALLAVGFTLWLSHSKLGYYLLAIREEEEAASVLGINLLKYKLYAMMISSFMTALGGTFYAQYQYYIDPDLAFGSALSTTIFLGAIIGGVGTVIGPVLGAGLLTLLSEVAKSFVRQHAGVDVMLYGAIVIVIILFLPEGLVSVGAALRRVRRRLSRRFRPIA